MRWQSQSLHPISKNAGAGTLNSAPPKIGSAAYFQYQYQHRGVLWQDHWKVNIKFKSPISTVAKPREAWDLSYLHPVKTKSFLRMAKSRSLIWLLSINSEFLSRDYIGSCHRRDCKTSPTRKSQNPLCWPRHILPVTSLVLLVRRRNLIRQKISGARNVINRWTYVLSFCRYILIINYVFSKGL